MKFTTDGLVIKETNIGESDRALTILTRDRGLLGAFVHGARKPGGKNTAASSLLTYSSFTVSKQKDVCRITESEPINHFFGLRGDVFALSLAEYICELCLYIVPYEEESEEYLRTALNSLHFIADAKHDLYALKAVTELRLMTTAGFMPDLVGCRECGKDTAFPLFLDLSGGDMICAECRAKKGIGGQLAEIDKTTLAAMRHIAFSDMNRLYSFTLPELSAKYLSIVTEKYLLCQTGHRFRTLDFWHSLETQI